MPRLPRRGMFFHVFSCRFVSCRFVPGRAMPRIMSWRAVSWRVVSFLAVLRCRQRAGLRRLRAESGGFSRRLCGCRMGSGRANAGPGVPCGEYGCCAAVRACPEGTDAARKGAGCRAGRAVLSVVRLCTGWLARPEGGSVQGVRRGRDCECRLYSLSLPRSAAGKCMAAAFRKDFGP